MEILAGRVRNYYSRIHVASIDVIESLKSGDRIHIKGHVTDFDQEVCSIEIRNCQVNEAENGVTAGIKVNEYVRKNDFIYKVKSR